MSANNVIYIKRDTFEVFYQGCADNDDLGTKIGKGKNLEEAVDIAYEYMGDDPMFMLEYGINFIPKKLNNKGEL